MAKRVRKSRVDVAHAKAYSGEGCNMRQESRGRSGAGTGWRYWDKPLGSKASGIHPDTEYLSKLDYKSPGSVGRFLPDMEAPLPPWLEPAWAHL